MTGYGHATEEDDQCSISVDIKSLNSRYTDVSVRVPKALSGKEMEIRAEIAERLQRGKISVVIDYIHKKGTDTLVHINQELFTHYYSQLKQMADDVHAETDDLFRLALQYPDVVVQKEDTSEADRAWSAVRQVMNLAIDQCIAFRKREGEELGKKLYAYAEEIGTLLESVSAFESARTIRVRERLKGNLREFADKNALDPNRLEQEIIYYIEKYDISEEKVRLRTHLDHLHEILRSENANGKKLGFITQEIGREINTIGSKANDADIQRLVVNMKEELEKIKEQSMNIV
jgi:uncharacterized protein (TIGR00255 family)